MKKFCYHLLLGSLLMLSSFYATAQCNIPTKISEKWIGGHSNFDQIKSVIDKENNIYIAATFRADSGTVIQQKRLDLGNGMLVPWTPWSIILVKFNKNMVPQWYRTITDNYHGWEPLLAIDSAGCIYAGRQSSQTVHTEGYTFSLESGGYFFKISPVGKVIWYKKIDSKVVNPGWGLGAPIFDLHVSRKGNVYALGNTISEMAIFDSITLNDPTPDNKSDDRPPYLAKYDSTGKIQWAKILGINKSTDPVSITKSDLLKMCTDENDNIYITGIVQGRPDLKFGNLLLKKDKIYPNNYYSWFIVKLNYKGDGVWGKIYTDYSITGINYSRFRYDEKGYLYYLFGYRDTTKMGNMTFQAPWGVKDYTGIIKFDTSGNILNYRDFSQPSQYKKSQNFPYDFKIDRQGNLYITGCIYRPGCFDTFCVANNDSLATQSFALKLRPDLKVTWAIFDNYYRFPDVFETLIIDDSGKVTLFEKRATLYDSIHGSGQILKVMQYKNSFTVLPYGTDNKCYDDQNGFIGLRILEGKRPYTVNWLGGYGSDTLLNGLRGGDYYAVVTDAQGCKDTVKTTIFNRSSKILITAVIVDDLKNTRDGEIWLTVSGGVPPFKYQWDDPFHQTTRDAFNLYGGTHTCHITDAIGCIKDTSFIVKKTVGTNPLDDNSTINYYPNPLRGSELQLELSTCTDPFTVMMYNPLGELIYQKSFECKPDSKYILSLPEMKKGIYHINVVSVNSIFTRNVVVEN